MICFPYEKNTHKVHNVKYGRRCNSKNHNRNHVNFNFVVIDDDTKTREMIPVEKSEDTNLLRCT